MTDSAMLWTRLREAAAIAEPPAPTPAPDKPASDAPSAPSTTDLAEPRGPSLPPPEPYLLDDDLAAAAEIALRLRQPLLLTGDPGCGKTRFALALAYQLGLPLVRCQIRSSTTVADLFYSIDDLARFRDAQPGGDGLQSTQYYLTFNGLGRAVLFAGGPDAKLERIRARLTRPARKIPPEASEKTGGRDGEKAPPPTTFRDLYPSEEFPRQPRVVVLLDEFDKAPRDTPNDMLNEIDEMAFEIAELGVRVAASTALRPITIITSNSERSLPDPFLRRCIFYDIPFPRDEALRDIVELHLPAFREAPPEAPLLSETLAAFARVREQGLMRKPGTAELLDWLRSLQAPPLALTPTQSLVERWRAGADAVRRTLATLLKSRDDQARAEQILSRSFSGLEATSRS